MNMVRSTLASLAAAALLCVASTASAQYQPPPDPNAPPPPAQPGQPPPPGYGQPPPPGYGQPPPPGQGYGYGLPPGVNMRGPETLPYVEGEPIPPGYRHDRKIRKGLVIGGAVTFGAVYLINVLAAAIADAADSVVDAATGQEVDHDFVPMYIPIVGPFITIGTADASGSGAAFLVLDGVAQAGGVAMLIVGLTVKKDVLVRRDVGGLGIDLEAKPIVSQNMQGFGLQGTF